MTTSPARVHVPTAPEGDGLRLVFSEAPHVDGVDGWWWPHGRDLQREAAMLVDQFPAERGRVHRLLFSRPDWDAEADAQGRGLRKIRAARGPVKVGSFPRDDTHLMVVALGMGRDLRLAVVREGD